MENLSRQSGYVASGLLEPRLTQPKLTALFVPNFVHRHDSLRPIATNVSRDVLNGFSESMLGLGYVEGRDFDTLYRYADNAPARMPEFARELTQLKPTVFKEESSTLPRFRQLIEGLLSSREATAISLDDQLGPRRLLSLGSRRHVS
jgi:hypothetical protein